MLVFVEMNFEVWIYGFFMFLTNEKIVIFITQIERLSVFQWPYLFEKHQKQYQFALRDKMASKFQILIGCLVRIIFPIKILVEVH
jgi:hypothetical protein